MSRTHPLPCWLRLIVLSVDQRCVQRDRFLQSLLGRVSLQIDPDGDVGIAGVSFTQTEKYRQINMTLQLYAQLFNLDASYRSVRCVSNRQTTAECSQQLLHGIGRCVCSPQHLRLISITRREITYANLVAEAALPDDRGFPDRVPLCGLLLNFVAQCGDPGSVDAIEGGHCAHSSLHS